MAGPVVQDDEDEAMSDINVVPLIDVMLVLLIIFLITVPVVVQTIPVKLPKVRYEADARPSRRTSRCRSATARAEPARSIGT